MKKIFCQVLLLWHIGFLTAPTFAVTIEGQTPAGNILSVGVDVNGALLVDSVGGSFCTAASFKNLAISSSVVGVLLPADATRAQSLIYVAGPNAIWLSTTTIATLGTTTPGALWAKFPAGSTFSLDTPASETPLVNAIAAGPAATTTVHISICQKQ